MNQSNQTRTTLLTRPRRWLLAFAVVGAVGIAAGGSSIASGMHHGCGHPGPGSMFGLGHHGDLAMNPAAMDKHINAMVEHILPDGTADQKTRLTAITKAALTDLQPMCKQFSEGHARAHAMLLAPVIDRAELEQLRAGQIRQLDEMSKRALSAVEDAADVLTPAQRAEFGERLQRHFH